MEMCYQTKRVGLRMHYKSIMCIYERSKPDFDRAKMKLTGHFDRSISSVILNSATSTEIAVYRVAA